MYGRGRGAGSMTRGGYGGASSGGGGRGRGAGSYTNPCLTMHQPWASLLIYGIKRVEGRSWPSPITGRLWIHAASKVPEEETIKAMENFYREIYAVDGITDIKFPEHYPVSRLLGCVEVVGCLQSEELVSWEGVPESVRLEGLTDFCWLCENPQRLPIPFEMRGNQGVYNLEKRIYEAAFRGLISVRGPLPVKFQLPDSTDHFSLRPGCLSSKASSSGAVVKSDRVNAATAGARAAATQFSRNMHSMGATPDNLNEGSAGVGRSIGRSGARIDGEQAEREPSLNNDRTMQTPKSEASAATIEGSLVTTSHSSSSHGMGPTERTSPEGGRSDEQGGRGRSNAQLGGTNKLLLAALKDIKSNKVC